MTVMGKKEALKDIIRDLNAGGDVDVLKKRFAALVQDVSGAEIGAMEQELLDEGLPEEKIRKLCDIHVKVFEESLDAQPAPQTVPGHPLHTLAEENKALKGVLAEVRAALAGIKPEPGIGIPPADAARLKDLLDDLSQVEKHYLKKENQLFPRLEGKGITGPSKVMWAVHDDIRAHLKDLRRALHLGDANLVVRTRELGPPGDRGHDRQGGEDPLPHEPRNARRIRLGPGQERGGGDRLCLDRCRPRPGRPRRPVRRRPPKPPARPRGGISLDTGRLSAEQIDLMLTRLPVDISFVDENDTVVYYSATPDRIFPRSPGVIGRKVQNCHPPKSLDVVERILRAFRSGERDEAQFWIESGGRFIHISYFAMRDGGGAYRGALEVTQDATAIRGLRGERRLLDWDKPGGEGDV